MSEPLHRIVLLGGPYDGSWANLTRQPNYIQVGDELYSRIDNPDDGVPLGAYAWER